MKEQLKKVAEALWVMRASPPKRAEFLIKVELLISALVL
jgi:hypothetical protein